MIQGFMSDYLPTTLRWALVGIVLVALMAATYWVLRRFKVKHGSAVGFVFVLPMTLGLLIFTLFPFLFSFYLSLTEFNMFQAPKWVGLANYTQMFGNDTYFWPSCSLTLKYALYSVPLSIIASVAVALLLNRPIKVVGFWRTLYYVPAVLPAAATMLLWRWMFAPNSGLINYMLSPFLMLFGLQPPEWYTDPQLVLSVFVITSLWGVFGANSVILLAGLKNVPTELYEAANLDGAGMLQKFRHITLPMISPTLFYTLITGIIGALQIFTQAFFMTIPANMGTFLSVRIYQEAFAFGHYGYAAAMAWFMLICIFALTLIVFKSSSAWVYYENEAK